jgi:hypothetical protein
MTKQNMQIYQWSLGNCSNNGLSSRLTAVTAHYKREREYPMDAKALTVQEAEAACENLPDDDVVIVEDISCGDQRIRAIPVKLMREKKWTMFGGTFIWTGDSRGFKHPIKLHDRYEES